MTRTIRSKCLLLFMAALFVCANASHGAAKPNAAKMKDIRKLTRLMGADKMANQLVEQLMAALKQNYPKVSEARWKKIRKKASVNSFLNEVAKVYDRHLTHSEVRDLMAFFMSPVGRKFVSIQPKLFQESMEIGNRWGQRVTEQITKELGEPR
jgi:hypothetical protein